MSNKGYGFEAEIESFFLDLTEKKRVDPIICTNGTFNRSFRIPCSGAMASMKGDVVGILPHLSKFIKVECKHRYEYTKKNGQFICVLKEWIDKNNEEADADNQISMLVIAFKRVQVGRCWFIIEQPYLYDCATYIPTVVRVDGCIKQGKSDKNPCFHLYKNLLLNSLNPKNYLEMGIFNIWGRNFYIISKGTMYRMLKN